MKVKVNKNRQVFKGSLSVGISNENNYEVLEFTFPAELDNYIKYIEIQAENEEGKLEYVDRIQDNKFTLTNRLTKYRELNMEVSCRDLNRTVFKSEIFTVTTGEALNILEELVEQQEDLFERVERELQEVYQGMEEFKTEIVEDANSRFNTNVREKTQGFDTNTETKTTDFNNNYDTKLNSFNSNYDEKLGTFNTNATSKLTEYNNNDTAKTGAYNTNATEKLSTYNQNATNKVAEYNSNAETKLNAYNTNATQKLAEYDSLVTALHEDLDETQAKVEQYNTNIDNKYTQYNSNAEQKMSAYNQNATTKTSAYNTNAQTKLEAYNTNATAKMTTYNENAEEKVQEYNENANALMQEVSELNEKIENIVPKNISNLFNDGFFALPIKSKYEINHGVSSNAGSTTNYSNNVKKVYFDTNNVAEGTGTNTYAYAIINENFAPKMKDGKLDKVIDLVINIEEIDPDYKYNIRFGFSAAWGTPSNLYNKTQVSAGTHILRFGDTNLDVEDDKVYKYIIIQGINNARVKASVSVYLENEYIKKIDNNIEALNQKIDDIEITPSQLSSKFNDNFYAIPFSNVVIFNHSAGSTGSLSIATNVQRAFADTNLVEPGSLNSTFIACNLKEDYRPTLSNGKLDKIIDVIVNIEDNGFENDTYNLYLARNTAWSNAIVKTNLKKGTNIVRFEGSSTITEEIIMRYILLRNNNYDHNVKASISAYMQNDYINYIDKTFEEINTKISFEKEIVCWGDSLTAQGGWTTRLQQLSGIQVYNAGTGGEKATTIMARQGGDVMMINNITIPASQTPIQIAPYSGIDTYLGNKSTPLRQGGTSHINPVKIGNIEGILEFTGSSYNDTTGVYTFTRSETGEEVIINRPTAIRTNFDRVHNSPYLMIIFMGQNGGYDNIEDLINKHKLMIKHAKAENIIILGLSSGSASSRQEYETAMKNEFGRYFISLREYLASPIYNENEEIVSCYGLADQDLTPSEEDLQQIATGTVPDSCLKDSVHYTDATKIVIGNMIYKKCCELGIF